MKHGETVLMKRGDETYGDTFGLRKVTSRLVQKVYCTCQCQEAVKMDPWKKEMSFLLGNCRFQGLIWFDT